MVKFTHRMRLRAALALSCQMADFRDRIAAGERLADRLAIFARRTDVIVLGLPRGGVVVAAVVAERLHLSLDCLAVRKIGAPANPEFAIGAVSMTGETVLDTAIIAEYGIADAYIRQTVQRELIEARRRMAVYRGDRPPLALADRVVIIVDDGLATGATMEAAVRTARRLGAREVIAAIPVASLDGLARIDTLADQTVTLLAPVSFLAVGEFYDLFPQIEDTEVIALLRDVPEVL